jgi:hypothetical protein
MEVKKINKNVINEFYNDFQNGSISCYKYHVEKIEKKSQN